MLESNSIQICKYVQDEIKQRNKGSDLNPDNERTFSTLYFNEKSLLDVVTLEERIIVTNL